MTLVPHVMRRRAEHARGRHDAGAGVALALAPIAAMLVLAGIILAASIAVVAAARVDAAADAAALAAADTLAGFATGDACDRATLVANANGAQLTACTIDGLVVTVSCADAGGLLVAATAVAGPPSER